MIGEKLQIFRFAGQTDRFAAGIKLFGRLRLIRHPLAGLTDDLGAIALRFVIDVKRDPIIKQGVLLIINLTRTNQGGHPFVRQTHQVGIIHGVLHNRCEGVGFNRGSGEQVQRHPG